MKLSQVIGQEQLVSHLLTAKKLNKVSHAYLFEGESGMGKKLVASLFAKALQCTEQEDSCGTCRSCLQADSGNQPDIIHVTHEKAHIGVEDIRTQVNADISIKPYSSPFKIYIIEDAVNMTEQAQNALLKTIEEPPAYAVIILLADNGGRLLPTILSRCVQLQFKPVERKQIEEFLVTEKMVSPERARTAAMFSGGNIGKAVRYATAEDFIALKEDVLHLAKNADEMPLSEIMDSVKKMGQYKLNIKDCIDLMTLWYRDVLMYKVTKDLNQLLFNEEYAAISKQASFRSYETIENIIQGMEKAKVRLDANVNFDTVIELMLLNLKD